MILLNCPLSVQDNFPRVVLEVVAGSFLHSTLQTTRTEGMSSDVNLRRYTGNERFRLFQDDRNVKVSELHM